MAGDRRAARAQAAAEKARLKAMRPWYKKKRFIIPGALVAIIVIAAVASGGGNDKAKKVGTATTEPGAPATTTGSTGGVFKVRDVVKLGDYQVVVHAVTNPLQPKGQFLRPAAGKHWVALDMEVTNTTARPLTFSILLAVELQDSKNQTYSVTLLTDADPKAPDGELPPNGAKRGMVVFEVPDDATGLRLLFKGAVFRTGQAVIQIT